MLKRIPIKMSPHQIGVQEMLLISELRGHCPEALYLWGVIPASLEPGSELTPRLRRVVAEMAQGDAKISVITLERNGGKGAALLKGFAAARELGATHAITIDADGQHDVQDILKLLEAAEEHRHDLIVGMRDMEAGGGANVPTASRKGKEFSRFWLRVQTGQDIPDSQCGLRVYPLEYVLGVKHRFPRFDFETETLARLAWAGVRVRSVSVKCIYFPPGKRVSHYRPFVDTVRGVWVNVFLVMRRMVPWPFRRLTKLDPAHEHLSLDKWWRWGTWRVAILRVVATGTSNSGLAAAFAMGVFIGLTPLYGLHTILAIYFARRLHLNVLAAVIGSQVSIPPLLPVWIYLSVGMGNLLVNGQWLALAHWSEIRSGMIPAMLLGNLIVAAAISALGLFLARGLLYCFRPAVARE